MIVNDIRKPRAAIGEHAVFVLCWLSMLYWAAKWRSEEQTGDAEGDEGCDPGKEDCVDGCDDGPFPASAFVLDGDKCGYAWEIEQDEGP